jgi:hypothetical protein
MHDKSPTESELVALTDNVGFVELFEEFTSRMIADGLIKALEGSAFTTFADFILGHHEIE